MATILLEVKMLEVKRSGAKVTWQVVYNGTVIGTRDTRKEAQSLCSSLARSYNLQTKGL